MACLCALADPGSGLINPKGIIFNPTTKKVYVVDTRHDAVDVIRTDDQSVTRVPVGGAPVSIAVDSHRAYVANSADGTVSIIDGNSDKVVATVPVGARPYSIAANPVTGVVYVSHTFSDKTTALDGATHAVTQLTTGSIDLIAVDSAANIAYLLGYEGGSVGILDGSSNSLRRAEAGKHAWGMTLNEATHTLYVARMGMASVIAIHGAASSILPAGHTPCAIAVNPTTDAIYVANYADGTVSILDGNNATIAVGVRPQAVAVDPVRNLAYVANRMSNTVTVIDGERRKAVATLPAGRAPYALAVDPGSSRIYVANEAGETNFTIVSN